jgi:hypothetical protein
MKTSELLTEALTLLGPNGENWTKGTYARDSDGTPVPWESGNAVKWCVMGAIRNRSYQTESVLTETEPTEYLRKSLNVEYNQQVVAVNDDPTTEFPIIKELLSKAVQLAQQDEVTA